MTARIKVATASPRSERPRVPPPAPDATPIGRDTEVSAEPGQVDKQMLPMPANQRAQTLLRQALELVATGHGRGALEKFLDALKLEPGLLSARRHAVTLQLELGQAAQAEALALQGLVLAPNEAQLNYLLARILAERGDAAGAIARLDNSHPLGGEAFGLRAGLHAQRGDFPRALSDYEHAVRLQPANSLWWLGLGVALESAGHAPQARQAYARAQSIGIERHDLNLFVDQKLATLEGMK